MPDEITAEDRDMIDAAVAQGKVTRLQPKPFEAEKQSDRIAARRAKVRSMIERGDTGAVICEALSISVATLHTDKKALGGMLGWARGRPHHCVSRQVPPLNPTLGYVPINSKPTERCNAILASFGKAMPA